MTREEAIYRLRNCAWLGTHKDREETEQAVEVAIKALQDRPQGKWKAKSFHEFFCDNCGFSFDMMKCDFLENMKFCPNCGARMGEMR